ncbi:hypothetical protein WISP_54087 [Willisornis vidua]|uniref:Sodium/hydrogen exchanger n=1 Tax=Willisornis vidua TaxID=1566151 RepID=A0ABQ9DIQ7_9PASS|nr:hypothetical protein WISP_54087 [Willisornis vidua]
MQGMEEQGSGAILPLLCCLLAAPRVGALQEPLLEDTALENISWAGNESSEHTFFSLDYQHVQVPFEITLWIMLASLAKIDMLHMRKISCISVLYKLFRSFCEMPTIKSVDVFAGVGQFFVVGLGGVLVGLSFGFTAAFTTRFTKDIRVIEPLFVFLYSYLSYLTAEMFHLSGIVAIIACAMGMKRYVEANISLKSHTTVKYFMKMWSSVSDTLIFIFLGVSTIGENHEWNWPYICFTLIFCLVWRALGVLVLTFFVNRFHVNSITSKDQFIIAYGGLRGAICFSLVFLLPDFHRKKLFIAATTVVILFTVFVQGMTIRPLVDLLAVKRKRESAPTVGEQIHIRFLDHLLAGIEDISGHWGQYYWKDKLEYFNSKYLQKILLREYDQPKSSIVLLYEKLERKHAMELAQAGQLGHGPAHPSLLNNDRTVLRDQKLEDTPNPDVLDNMQEILARNLYRIRRTGPAYSRHTLPGDCEPGEHPQELLILRHHGRRPDTSGGGSRKEVRAGRERWDLQGPGSQKDDSCSAQSDPAPQPKLCRSFTMGNTEKVREVKENRSKSVCIIPPPQPGGTAWAQGKDVGKELTLEMHKHQ